MSITVIVGSTLGNAEYLSDHIVNQLENKGFEVKHHYNCQVEDIINTKRLLVVTSTHGVGEIPFNLDETFNELEEMKVNLQHLKFAVVALGSRDYDLFCGAYDKVAEILKNKKAVELCDPLKIDCSEVFDHDSAYDEWSSNFYEAL